MTEAVSQERLLYWQRRLRLQDWTVQLQVSYHGH